MQSLLLAPAELIAEMQEHSLRSESVQTIHKRVSDSKRVAWTAIIILFASTDPPQHRAAESNDDEEQLSSPVIVVTVLYAPT